jgi:hypothetical protein
LGTFVRVLFGFIVACLVAGVAIVAFVVTPADIASLPSNVQPERLSSAGMLSLLAATHSAIFAFPWALLAIIIGEWLSVRSWIYYALVGIAIALGGFGAEYLTEVGGEPTIVNDYAFRAFLTVGFFGGFAYWLAAGRRAGGRRGDEALSREADDESEPDTAEKQAA